MYSRPDFSYVSLQALKIPLDRSSFSVNCIPVFALFDGFRPLTGHDSYVFI